MSTIGKEKQTISLLSSDEDDSEFDVDPDPDDLEEPLVPPKGGKSADVSLDSEAEDSDVRMVDDEDDEEDEEDEADEPVEDDEKVPSEGNEVEDNDLSEGASSSSDENQAKVESKEVGTAEHATSTGQLEVKAAETKVPTTILSSLI